GSEGGMIVSNDEKLAQRARKFAGIGYKHMTAEAGRTSLAMSTVQDPSYERFDTVGLNYRMTEMSAAIGLAQFERIESMVLRRRAVAKLFDEAVEDCTWLVRQEIPDGYVHSYYTYAVKYFGDENFGVSWKDFYNRYVEMGGDGFYGACKIPYLEPVFKDLEINGVRYEEGLCPVAEEIQPRIMQFKTNYRDMEIAKKKAGILEKVINKLGRVK
ncbi:MAG: DegT/DnrJ/EryC1/StrS family aminotransferase, partial [Bacteroidia bacterium]|nr:DegT/DnrJ/EryC1/StrS family aminotransferase [Bacteroidia bacterium]